MLLAYFALILQAGRPWPAVTTTPVSAVAAPSPGGPASAPAQRLRVLVSIDPRGAGKGIRIPEVIDQVREIWRPYIDIDFDDAGEGSVARYDDELRLLIIDSPRASGSPNAAALGWIEFVAGQPAHTITVSVGAARALMSQGRWLGRPIEELPLPLQRQFVTHALGRSAAHEIGHYLLQSSTHAPDGLMRERMTVSEIMEQGLWRFQLRASEVNVLERRAPKALASAAKNAEIGC